MNSSSVPITDILPYTQTSSSAGQTIYSTTWTANTASDVVVYYTPNGDAPNDEAQILNYPADYSVAFIGGSAIVQVTLVTPANSGDIVTITRQTPANRLNLYSNTNFTPSMLNNDFGILTLVDQQAQLVNQLIAPRYNYSAQIDTNMSFPTADTILPILGPSQIWIKSPDGSAILAADIDVSASGTVNLGLINQLAYYATTGTEVSGLTTANNGVLATSNSGVPSISSTLPSAVQLNITKLGVQSQALNMNSHLINNVTNPSSPQDAATKAYVDAQVSAGDPLTTKGDLFTFSNAAARLPVGTVDTQILQVSSAAATGLAWSTATYPATTTINQLLYSSSNNTVIGLTTANNGTLITSAGGVPSISSTLPNAVQVNITALGAQSQALNMNTHLINNVVDPVNPQDAATKAYVDQTALNGTSVYAATTTNLTVTQSGAGVGATLTNAGVQATFSIDGVSPPVGSNVLIKNLTNAANEGIYTVTNVGSGSSNWVLTRATSYDTPSEINNTGLIVVQNGSTLAGTAWYNAATIVTVDTTNFSYNEFGNIVFPISLAHGGTSANLTASNGGLVYSGSSSLAILSGTATANQIPLSGSNAAPSWSTATYPATTTINQILYSNASNTITGLATANGGVLVTSNSGVPSILVGSGTTGTVLQATASGTPAWSTATYPLTTTINQLLYSSSANVVAGLSTVNSAGLLTNSSGVPGWVAYTGTGAPVLANTPTLITPVLGAATATSINFGASATNGIIGITGASSAASGVVGEVISSAVADSTVSLSNATPANVTTISLTAGQWDVTGSVFFVPGGTQTTAIGSINTASATVASSTSPVIGASVFQLTGLALANSSQITIPRCIINVNTTTTVYLVARASFSVSCTAGGTIIATRMR